jgi:hypothetical protein
LTTAISPSVGNITTPSCGSQAVWADRSRGKRSPIVAEQVLAARAARFSRLLDGVPHDKHDTVIEALQLLKAATDALD